MYCVTIVCNGPISRGSSTDAMAPATCATRAGVDGRRSKSIRRRGDGRRTNRDAAKPMATAAISATGTALLTATPLRVSSVNARSSLRRCDNRRSTSAISSSSDRSVRRMFLLRVRDVVLVLAQLAQRRREQQIGNLRFPPERDADRNGDVDDRGDDECDAPACTGANGPYDGSGDERHPRRDDKDRDDDPRRDHLDERDARALQLEHGEQRVILNQPLDVGPGNREFRRTVCVRAHCCFPKWMTRHRSAADATRRFGTRIIRDSCNRHAMMGWLAWAKCQLKRAAKPPSRAAH